MTKRKIISMLVAVMLMLTMVPTGSFAEDKALTDGVYEGSATGYNGGTTKVSVTVTEGKIADINVISHEDTEIYWNFASETVIKNILDKQTTDADTVSGATFTSNGIKNAVADALGNAVPKSGPFEVANWAQLQGALSSAADGDTIVLTADITDGGVNSSYDALPQETLDAISSATSNGVDGIRATANVFNDITIDGQGHTIKAADGKQCAFYITADNATIKNVTLSGLNYNNYIGGAVYLQTEADDLTTELTLENVNFINCSGDKANDRNAGGAVYAESHVDGNGIANNGTPKLNIYNCSFVNNSVSSKNGLGRGGAVAGLQADIRIENSTFSGNTAKYGGAICVFGENSKLTVRGCVFEADNDATYGGDDIYVFDGYTWQKKKEQRDSSVNVVLSGNTHKGSDGDDFTSYRVVRASVLGKVTDTVNKPESYNYGEDYEYKGSGVDVDGARNLVFDSADVNRTQAPVGDVDTENVKTWKKLYEELIGGTVSEEDGYYDVVSTATKIGPNVHYQHIPEVVNKDIIEENPENPAKPLEVALNGVRADVKPGDKEVKLSSANWKTLRKAAANKQYGTDEFEIYPDDTVEGYAWSDYLMAIYAVTISDGKTTVGALPWVDFYGEKATSGPHYNKVEIALGSGDVPCRANETVKRFDDFFTDGVLNPGTYTVTVYADDYKPLTAEVVVPVYTDATAVIEDAKLGDATTEVTFNNLPDDYDVVLEMDGEDATINAGSMNIEGASLGNHTVTVSDAAGKYNSFTATFTVTTDQVLAKYDGEKLVAADGVSEELFAAYLANVTKVTIADKGYNATGRGAVKVVQPDGTLDLSKTDFAERADELDTVVTSTGSPDLSFTLNKKEEPSDQPTEPGDQPTEPSDQPTEPGDQPTDTPTEDPGEDPSDDPSNADEASYDFTSGASSTWDKGSKETLDFVIKRSADDESAFDKFQGIKVDGQTVDTDNYTAAAGSVKLSLRPEYLESLLAGSHKLAAMFADGNATTDFTIKQSEPATKDDSQKSTTTGDSTKGSDTTVTKIADATKVASAGNASTASATGNKSTGTSAAASKAVATGDNTSLQLMLAVFLLMSGIVVIMASRRLKQNR